MHVGDAPPADTRTAAALTTLAVQLLTAGPDGEELIRLLEHRRIGWPGRLRLQQLAPHTSPAVSRALQNTPPLGKPRARSAARRAKLVPGRHERFEARHVPARLPHEWTALLTGLEVEPTALRRDAALQLVQMSLGLPRRAAARYLGLSPALLQHTTSVMNRSLHHGHKNHEYGQQLLRLADLVSRLDAPIDYHRRRQDPRAAGLPASDWAELADAVRTHTSTLYHGPAWWSPIRHAAASTVLWTHLTHGELELAPALQTCAGREEPGRLLREARWIQAPGPQDRVRQHLRDRLLAYAAQLAQDIDSPHRERMFV